MLLNTDHVRRWHGESKLTSFCCPRQFTALLCLSSGILHHLPELNDESHTKVVISQRLKGDATFSKLKSKENTRHNSKAADALCFLLEDHARFLAQAVGVIGKKNTSGRLFVALDSSLLCCVSRQESFITCLN